MPIIPKNPSNIPVPVTEGGTGSTTAPNAAEALGVGATDTPTFAGVNLGDENLNDYDEGTFTPTVTLVGGAGNTVPEYTTNLGRYTRIGRMCFATIKLAGDGGDEGAGTGRMNIALPFTSANTGQTINQTQGYLANGGVTNVGIIEISPSGNVLQLSYFDTITSFSQYLGSHQDNAGRFIILNFSYEVA